MDVRNSKRVVAKAPFVCPDVISWSLFFFMVGATGPHFDQPQLVTKIVTPDATQQALTGLSKLHSTSHPVADL